MKDNFDVCYKIVLEREGGYSNHPRDKGGSTFQGVTQKVYAEWRNQHGWESRDVREMTPLERLGVYRDGYWKKVRADELPLGVDLVVFNAAVNSGPGRAIQLLQKALYGPAVDGVLGKKTMEALKASRPRLVVINFGNLYEEYYRAHDDFDVFGEGWLNRNRIVTYEAVGMTQPV